MNVHVPGQNDTDTYHWFIGIVCVLVSFGLVGGFVAYKVMQKSWKR
jgi:Mg2+ and Co2+ transporter CorA